MTIKNASRFEKVQVSVTPHAVELQYAVTYHKVQGQTVSAAILDLSKPARHRFQLPLLYVGITRVRHGKDLAILTDLPETYEHLRNMHHEPEILAGLQSYDKNGKLDPVKAAER